jgi:hypothetical protein
MSFKLPPNFCNQDFCASLVRAVDRAHELLFSISIFPSRSSHDHEIADWPASFTRNYKKPRASDFCVVFSCISMEKYILAARPPPLPPHLVFYLTFPKFWMLYSSFMFKFSLKRVSYSLFQSVTAIVSITWRKLCFLFSLAVYLLH